MKISKKMNSILKGVIAAMPAIPYVMKARRRAPIAAYVLGGIGVAVAGGIAALMLFSPRTRHRALDVAKDTYGKVNEKVSHLRPSARHSQAQPDEIPVSNGLSGRDFDATTGI